ncbi:MAG: ribokinase [Gammaproteobacteria bacterium]|nr:ribokinase [Gammaproteobacteria bacterium]
MSVPRTVIIDTDPGIDDALALALAFNSPELEVAAVHTVAGNVDIAPATLNAGLLLELFGAPGDCVLAKGSAKPLRGRREDAHYFHGGDGLGGTRAGLEERGLVPRRARSGAVGRIVKAARALGPKLTIVALGPLTNIAHAMRRDPPALSSIGALVIMGGAVRVPGNVTAAAEFNFYADAHAAARVLAADLPVTLIPLDVTEQVRLTPGDVRDALAGRRDPQARALRALLAEPLRRQRQAGIALHDPLAVAAVIEPELVSTETVLLSVVTGGAAAGMSLEDARVFSTKSKVGKPVQVAFDVDAEHARHLFLSRVMRKPDDAQLVQERRGVVVVGSTNFDLVVRAEHLPRAGETVLGSDLLQTAGGKGANQAVAASQAGADVRLISRVGKDEFGGVLLKRLAAAGVNVTGVERDPRSTGVALITVDRHGQNQITVAMGANDAMREEQVDKLSGIITGAAVVVAQLEIPIETVIAALSNAHEAGVTTILNPAPIRPLPPYLAGMIDILVANEVEAEALVGSPVGTMPEVRRALATLASMGYTNAVITLGRRGAMWRADGKQGRVAGQAVEAVDTTAAGDTFIGYLAAAVAEGQALVEAVILANQAAALTVMETGALDTIPSREQVVSHFDKPR